MYIMIQRQPRNNYKGLKGDNNDSRSTHGDQLNPRCLKSLQVNTQVTFKSNLLPGWAIMNIMLYQYRDLKPHGFSVGFIAGGRRCTFLFVFVLWLLILVRDTHLMAVRNEKVRELCLLLLCFHKPRRVTSFRKLFFLPLNSTTSLKPHIPLQHFCLRLGLV